jgi:hypothetical protein
MIYSLRIGKEPMLVVEFGTGDIEITGFELDNKGKGCLGLKELDVPMPIGDIIEYGNDGKTLKEISPTVLMTFSEVKSIETLIDMLKKVRDKMMPPSPGLTKFHVNYFYHATGMELGPDEKDYGIVEAKDEDDAILQVGMREYPEDIMYGPNDSYSTREFFIGCLNAKKV